MPLDLYADKLPAELQETYKAEIAKYVQVDSREVAKELLAKNQHFSAEFQSALSLKHEDSMRKFQQEKLPELIESEIKKRSTKDPSTLEIEKLRAEIAEEKKNGLLKERKSQAIAELSKIGLDPELADFVLDADEELFRAKIEKLTGKVTSWRDNEMKKLYGQKAPQGGSPKEVPKMSLDAFNALSHADRSAFAKAGGILE